MRGTSSFRDFRVNSSDGRTVTKIERFFIFLDKIVLIAITKIFHKNVTDD